MKRLLLLAALSTIASPGCTNPFENVCFVEGTDLMFPQKTCPAPCFVDSDGDGIGKDFVEPDEAIDCSATQGYSDLEGDCDDTDGNRFPNNPEVCDGRDNDCLPVYKPNDDGSITEFDAPDVDGLPNFDVEGEKETEEGSLIFTCPPPQPAPPMNGSATPDDVGQDEIRFFVSGGGTLDGHRVDARDFEVEVEGGQPFDGIINLRILAGPTAADNANIVASKSWVSPRESGLVPGSELFGEAGVEAGVSTRSLEVSATAPDYIEDGGDRNHHFLVLAGSSYIGQPVHIGALTHSKYCLSDTKIETDEECDEVWAPPRDPDDPPSVVRDLADMDALDLAACRSYGAARVPVLGRAVAPSDESCTLGGSEPDQDCVPLVEPFQIGCAFLSLVVVEPTE